MHGMDKLAWGVLAKRLAKAIGFILLIIGFGYGVFKVASVIANSEYAEVGGKILFYGALSSLALIIAVFSMINWKERIKKELMQDALYTKPDVGVRPE